VKTDDLIVQIAADARPVRVLPAPSVRFARWALAMVAFVALGVVMIGLRPDVSSAIGDPAFIVRLLTTVLAALLAAASAFAMSVPGAERSPIQHLLPLAALSAWAVFLLVLLTGGGNPSQRLLAWPINWPCGVKITGLAIVPGCALFAMLRRAAPLRPTWNAVLAALAAAALGAAATQFSCPVDDPAHQLVGHVLPVVILSILGALAGRRSMDWARRY
jgi:hypothetical protein